MVSICPLLWQRDVKLQQTKPNDMELSKQMYHINILIHTIAPNVPH